LKIRDFLDAAGVIPDLQGRDKQAVLKEMAERVAFHHPSLNPQELLRVLAEREKISSTAIGEGIAIPHGKVSRANQVYGVFARSLQGIDFNSLDGQPTYLFFVLIAPENSAGDHLKALARISRLFKDRDFRGRLMKGKSSQEIFDTIREEDERI
jgi:PTS system nitrogen regulatory IIA component